MLLFCNSNSDSMSHLINCVHRFAISSGLHPSLAKSTVFFGNCRPDFITWFDQNFGIDHGVLPVKFLGVPLISSMLSHNNCIPLLEKVTARIGFWTSLLLSFVGRVQLLRTILFAMQAYWTRNFILPQSVHSKLQTLFTRFLWKGDINSKGGAKITG